METAICRTRGNGSILTFSFVYRIHEYIDWQKRVGANLYHFLDRSVMDIMDKVRRNGNNPRYTFALKHYRIVSVLSENIAMHTQFIDFLRGCELQLILWSDQIATKYVFLKIYLTCIPKYMNNSSVFSIWFSMMWKVYDIKSLKLKNFEIWIRKPKSFLVVTTKRFSSLHWVVLPVFTRKDYIGISRHKTIENLEFSSGSQHSHEYASDDSHKKVPLSNILRIY